MFEQIETLFLWPKFDLKSILTQFDWYNPILTCFETIICQHIFDLSNISSKGKGEKILATIFVVPKPSDPSLQNGEFGLPIYLSVGVLALLLAIASNTALIAQLFHIFCHKPDPCPLFTPYLSLFFSRYLTLLFVFAHPFLLFLPSFLKSPLSGDSNDYFSTLSHMAPTSAQNLS